MVKQVQYRGGTALENDAYTGPVREITVDTTNHDLRVHDGQTPGGHVLRSGLEDMIDYIVASQAPTSQNNYTWYRKYKSGWVEQGGILFPPAGGANTVMLPVTMADVNYTALANARASAYVSDTSTGNKNTMANYAAFIYGATVNSVNIRGSAEAGQNGIYWQVKGYAA